MECKKDSTVCSCPKTGCKNHAVCCTCIVKHRETHSLPACVFAGLPVPDRSFGTFAKLVLAGKL